MSGKGSFGAGVKPTTRTRVLVIGGGPAGLSIGHELKNFNVEFLILEGGTVPGHAWTQMPRNLKLLSPWSQNVLPGTATGLVDMFQLRTARQFAEYLQQYSRNHDLPVLTNARVTRLERTAQGHFIAETADSFFEADAVVNATGYYGQPVTPVFSGSDTSAIPQIHVANYYDPARLRDRFGDVKKVLIVGKRISAGQTALELFDAGFDVAISHRSRIRFSQHPYLITLSFSIYYLIEDLVVRFRPHAMPDSFPPMEGGRMRSLIKSGKVGVRPQIRSFEERAIVFQDGSTETFDLVIYATGFRPALGHLQSAVAVDPQNGLPSLVNTECAHAPGLFFIGLDRQRSFRSRYLRGIREDARYVAARVKAFVEKQPARRSEGLAGTELERSEDVLAGL